MSNDIIELREHLFDTLRGLKDKSIDLDQAKAICEVAKNITDTAKVEVDFMRVAEADGTGFMGAPNAARKITSRDDKGNSTTVQQFPGFSITTHKAK